MSRRSYAHWRSAFTQDRVGRLLLRSWFMSDRHGEQRFGGRDGEDILILLVLLFRDFTLFDRSLLA